MLRGNQCICKQLITVVEKEWLEMEKQLTKRQACFDGVQLYENNERE